MDIKKSLESIPFPILYRVAFIRNNTIGTLLQKAEVEHGFTRPELTIIVALANQGGITAQDIANFTQQPKNTLSRGVEQLLKKKIIYRTQDESDRRRHALHLTALGRKSYVKVAPLFMDNESRMLGGLSRAETRQLQKLLTKLCDHIIDES